MKEYITHDNGGRPFKVVITVQDDDLSQNTQLCTSGTIVYKVYIQNHTDEDYNRDLPYTELLMSGTAKKVFIGKSPKIEMTTFSRAHGPEYDGNSILIYTERNCQQYKYLFIGSEIFEFTTDSEITSFISPVGNNDVPYPYAIDQNARIYLMIENSTYIPTEPVTPDPYRYFYNKLSRIDLKHHGYTDTIWYVDTEEYTNMSWKPNPEEHYDWMLRTSQENPGNFVPPAWDPEPKMWIKSSGHVCELTKDQYVGIHQEHGARYGIMDFQNKNVLHSRR